MTKKPSSKPGGGAVIYRRFRRVRGGRVLDAHDYGYKAWPIVLK
jgi:hypothetical protein